MDHMTLRLPLCLALNEYSKLLNDFNGLENGANGLVFFK